MCPVNHIRQGHVMTSFGLFCLSFPFFVTWMDVQCGFWGVTALSNCLKLKRNLESKLWKQLGHFFFKKWKDRFTSFSLIGQCEVMTTLKPYPHCPCLCTDVSYFVAVRLLMDMVRVCPSSTTGNPLHPDVFDRVPVTATPVFVLLNPGFRVFYKIFLCFQFLCCCISP